MKKTVFKRKINKNDQNEEKLATDKNIKAMLQQGRQQQHE